MKNDTQFTVAAGPFSFFWDLVMNNLWEEETFRIFDRFLSPDFSYLDVGAWIGPTVLYGAHKARHVYALEPDPVAFSELMKNLRLNPSLAAKVTAVADALAPATGVMQFYPRTAAGDSSSSMIPTLQDDGSWSVNGTYIEEFVREHAIEDVNFIKMDIEAGEYFVIPAMTEFLKATRPVLYLSIHPQFLYEAMRLKAQSSMTRPSEDDKRSTRPKNLIRRLVNSLDFYKYIYTSNGEKVNRSSILKVRDFGQFVFSDNPW